VIGAALVTIAFGAIGSGVWELLAKPGLGRLGHLLFSAVTFGSHAARDAVYSSAALDPTPLAALYVLSVLASVPAFLAGALLVWGEARRFMKKLNQRLAAAESVDAASDNDPAEEAARRLEQLNKFREELKIERAQLEKQSRIVNAALAVVLIAGIIMAMVGFSILSQAVSVWRTYHANLKICAPFMSSQEIAASEAAFASMKSKDDYDRIDAKFVTIALSHHVSTITMR